MRDELEIFLAGFILGALLITIVGILAGRSACNSIRSEAVEAGVAYYEANPQTGEIKFVWKEAGE